MRENLTTGRVRAARVLGITADFVQIGLLPLFAPGWISVVNDALDLVVAAGMLAHVGWHWAFVPAFLCELVPFLDLVPSWTAAVLIATRGGALTPGGPGGPERADVPRLPAA